MSQLRIKCDKFMVAICPEENPTYVPFQYITRLRILPGDQEDIKMRTGGRAHPANPAVCTAKTSFENQRLYGFTDKGIADRVVGKAVRFSTGLFDDDPDLFREVWVQG